MPASLRRGAAQAADPNLPLAMVHASAEATAKSHHAQGLAPPAAAECAQSWRLASITTSRPVKAFLYLSATGAQAQ